MDKYLFCTVGLPRSGKTTWSKKMREQNHAVVVNPDDIRLAIHGRKYYGPAEHLVTYITEVMVNALFASGHKLVIVDEVHITKAFRQKWLCDKWETRYVYFNTPASECIRRFKTAPYESSPELVQVIYDMNANFEYFSEDELIYVRSAEETLNQFS